MTFLIIGHDGLDARLCRDFGSLKDGELRIMRSVYAATVPSWTSIYTGMELKEHRIGSRRASSWRDWLFNQVPTTIKQDSETGLPLRYEHDYRDLPLVWKDLNALGFTVSLFGMPLTFPPFRVKGWCVSGFPCLPDPKKICYPLDAAFLLNEYPVDIFQVIDEKFVTHFQRIERRHYEDFMSKGGVKLIAEHVTRRLKNLARLWIWQSTDIIFVGFSFVDHAGHIGIVNENQLKAVYNIADWSILKTMEIIEPEKVLIVSDHGGEIVTVDEKNGVKYRGFKHTDTGVFFIQGDVMDNQIRHEYEIKEEIMRIAKAGMSK